MVARNRERSGTRRSGARWTTARPALVLSGVLAVMAGASGETATHAAVHAGSPGTTPSRPEMSTAALVSGGECTFPMSRQIKGRPWALQRVVFERLWQESRGRDVRVAVIDTGVDNDNRQLADAVDTKHGVDMVDGKGDGTQDPVGHGTKVAGIIAARPLEGTGFVGLAPEATIIPIRQHDGEDVGTPDSLGAAVHKALEAKADIINISQETNGKISEDSKLAAAVRTAVANDVLVVASAGNHGADGKRSTTYPAALPGVLAVASSDRNNERAVFSQSGSFVDVAAPGVDIVSTVPKGGQCVDNGTSFSAPYVSGVAALLRAKYPNWDVEQITARIQQTAERSVNGRDDFVGWGVVDPVRALTADTPPAREPTPEPSPSQVRAPDPIPLTLGESEQERTERHASYALGAVGVAVAVIVGTAVVWRDARRSRERR